ncbi:retention module-containing protein [Pseudomonas sp. PDM23]|uniref:retention module-containing protein n=1 Tax=unclassified Pseudomonas TaxID=196821 RepID=UPI001781FC99|nr:MULTISPECIES: retention module-containing protein [unclassified Pseudomonas]MBD9574350.1 retention module-containing protein [Pseudomonas sp. PDM23]MBD9673272.1 retention module-containing protein [Pseudomonas sp. PDM21]
MSSVVAVVKSIIGQVIAVSPEGAQRVLVEGDRIYQGEQLLTGASGAVTLDVGKGKLVDLGRDSQWSSADLPQPEAHHAAAQPTNAPSTEDLQKAIAAGLDPTQALAPTAAGPTAAPSAAGGNGGVGGGHSFVVLDATAGRVDPNIGYTTSGLDNGGATGDERQNELPANLAPQFEDGGNGVLNLTTAEDTLLTGAFSARDPNGDLISYSVGQAPANGLLVLNPNGTWQYNPNGDYNGADSFTVIVTDSRGASSTLVVNVGITPVNDAPVATGTYTSAITDTAANDSFADIKGQLTATDVDDTNLTWSGSAKGAYGELTVNADGSYTYVVDANAVNALPLGQNPSENFTVTVTDPSGATDTRIITINVQGANDTPVAQDGQASGNEDSVIGGQLVATDRDTGSTLTFTTNGNPPAGFTLKPDGSWTFDGKDPAYQHLAEGETQVVQVPYTVTDEHGATSTATLTVTLTGTNDAPVALPGVATTEENSLLNGQVPAASDVDGSVAGYQLTTGVGTGNGNLTFNPDGSYSFNPGKDFDSLAQGETRDVTFTYQAKDDNGALSDPQTITITVTGTNDAPVALPGVATTEENTVLNGQVPAATDVDGSVAGYQLTTDVGQGNGSLTFNPDGSYSFNPGKDFDSLAQGETRDVTFTYQAKDNNGALSDPQTVTITVTGTNDAAVITGQTSGSADETNAPVTIDGKLNISDVDSSASFQVQTGTAGDYGKFSVAADGSWSYVASSAFNELKVGEHLTDSFTVLAADGTSTIVTVTINGTNDAPVASADSQTTEENSVLNGQVPTATDVDGTVAGYQLATSVAAGKGTLTFNADGSYRFDPGTAFDHLAAGQNEAVTFTYQAKDNNGALSDPQTVTITVTGTNDAAVITGQTSGSADETNAPVTIDGKLNISDVDSPASFQVQTGTAGDYGKFSVAADGSWTYVTNEAFNELKDGEHQTESFNVLAADGTSTTVTVTLIGTNDAPVAIAGTATTEENAVLNGQVPAASDVDGTVVSYQLTTDVAQGKGSLTFNANGSYSFNPGTAFDHLAAGAEETVTFTYQAKDNNGALSDPQTVTITVTGTNDAPIAYADSATTEENTVFNGQVPTASDVDGSITGYQLVTGVGANNGTLTFNADGSYSFNPGKDFDGLAEGESRDIAFTYQAKDDNGALSDPQTITITVTGSNDAPVASATTGAVKEDAQISGQLAATDADNGAQLSYALDKAAPAGFSIDADGKWTFDASGSEYQHLKAGATQTLSIPFTVTDEHGATSSSSLTITITGTNDAPVANAASAKVGEDKFSFGKLTASDVDDGAKLSFSLNDKAPAGFTLFKDGTWAFSGLDPAYQSLAAGETKVLSIDYTVTDEHGATSTNTLTLTVTGTNDTPIALPSLLNGVKEDAQISGELKAIDVDNGAQLTYSLNKAAPAGLTLNSDGKWSFDASDAAYQHLKAGATQLISVGYTVTDEHGASTQSVLVITVTGTNDAPKADAATAAAKEDAVSKGQLTATDVDDGAKLSFSVSGNPPAGFTLKTDGSWSFDGKNPAYQSLAEGETKDVQVKYIVTDEHGATDTQTLTITVTGSNDPAVIGGVASVNVNETNAPVTTGGLLTVSDVDGPASFQAQSNVAGKYGTFSLGTDGTWTYTANDAYNELKQDEKLTDSFTVKATDGTSATVTVNIVGTNDAPVAFGDSKTTGENAAFTSQVPLATDIDGSVVGYELATDVGQGHGSLTFNADGSYTFEPGTDFDHLAAGESQDVTFTYQAKDDNGALSDPQTITITVTGSNDAAVISGQTSVSVYETNAPISTSGQLAISDVDSPETFQAQSNVAGKYGTFNLGADGQWTYTASSAYNELKVGETLVDTFAVKAADGTASSVTVNIVGTNDAPVAYPATASAVEGGIKDPGVVAGATDGSSVTLTITTTQPGEAVSFNWKFSTNDESAFNDFAYVQVNGQKVQLLSSVALVGDGGSSGLQTFQQVFDKPGTYTIVLGVSDAVDKSVDSTLVLSNLPSQVSVGNVVGQVTHTGSNWTLTTSGANNTTLANQLKPVSEITGKLQATDVDHDAQLTFSTAQNTAGFTLKSDGSWLFDAKDPAYDHLAQGETQTLAINYTVTDEHGATGTSTLTLTITGTNDAPVAGVMKETVYEDSKIGGQLAGSDVDHNAVLTFATTGSLPAGFSSDSSGKWSFDAGNAAYQHLAVGATQEFTVNYSVTDQYGAKSTSTLTITVIGTNDAPQAKAASASVNEDKISGGTLTATDVDDGHALYFSLKDAAPSGFTLNANGTWSFNGNHADYQKLGAGETLELQIKFIVTDDKGATDENVLTLTVTGSNDAAIISGAKIVNVYETDAPITTTGKLDVSDVDGPDTFQAQTNVAGKYGTFNLGTDGTWTYVAKDAYNELKPGESLTDTFTVKAADGTSSSVTVNILGTNDAPTAYDDNVTIDENGRVNGKVPAATDPDGKVSSYQLVTDVGQGNGSLNFNSSGTYHFEPGSDFDHLAAGESQVVTFTYQAKDNNGALSEPKTITITVTGSNDAAVISGVKSSSVNETDAPVSTGGKLNVSDVDGPETFQAQNNVAGKYGTFNLGTDGNWTYVAKDAYNELKVGQSLTDTFTVKAADGTSATVTVNIVGTNDAPVAFDGTATTGENSVYSGQVPTATDVDGTIASYQLATNVAAGKGTLTFNANGSYSFNPGSAFDHLAAGQSETVSFTYQAKDNNGALSDPQTITITVNGTNDAPVAYADSKTTEENTVLNGQVPTATDVDGSVAGYQLTTSVAAGKGTLTFNSDGSYSFNPGTAFDHLAAGQNEAVTFTYQAKDNNGALSDPKTITITVIGSNDAAVITGQTSGSADETNAPVTIDGKLDISDVDGPASFQVQTDTAGTFGKFSVAADGTWSYVTNEAFNELKDGEHQTESFTVLAADGTSTSVTVTLIGTNDAPVAYADSKTTEENTVLNGQVPTATDVDGSVAGYQLTTNVAAGKGTLTFNSDGSYSFNPGAAFDHLAAGQSEAVTFTYQAKDNNGALSDPQTITITVNGSNDAAVIGGLSTANVYETDAPVTTNGQLSISDVDSPESFQAQSSTGKYGTFNLGSDGAWVYTAKDAYNELKDGQTLTDTFTVKAFDGTSSTVTVNIVGTNDKPVAFADTVSTDENAVFNGQVPVATDFDGTVASYQLTTNVAAGKGTLTFNTDGSYSFDPGAAFDHLPAGQSEAVTFTYQAKDNNGALSDPQTVTITVTGSNDAAVITGQNSGSADETNAPVTIGGKLNVTDVDGPASFQAQTDTAGTNGKFSIAIDGTWTYVANSAFNELKAGEHLVETFIVKAADGTSSNVTVTINGTNDAPVAYADTQTTGENAVYQGQVPVATDVDGTIASYQLATGIGGGKGTLTFNSDGSYTFNPGTAFDYLAAGQTQDVTFTYQAKDNNGALSDPKTITITVTGTNDAAVITGQNSGSADETNAPVTIAGKLIVNDVDSPAVFQAQTDTAGTNGKFSIAIDGTWTYVANSAFNELKAGEHLVETFIVKAADGTSTNVTVTINGTNDAPVAYADTQTTGENAVLQGQVPVATDVDGTIASYQLVTNVAAGKGTLTFNANGSYTFNPGTAFDHLAAGAHELVTFTYQAKDNNGALSDPKTITIDVTGTNDRPVAADGTASTGENTVLQGQVPVATDIDGTVVGYQLATDVAQGKGSLVFNANGSYTFTPGTAFDHLAAGQSETVTFTYQAKDNDGALSDPKTITITVNGSNDAPNGADNTITLSEDSSRSFSAADFGFSDVDAGDTLSGVRIDSLPTNGTLKFNGNAVTAGQVIDAADLGKLVFTPAANANGNNYANFTFSVKDSSNTYDTTPNKITFNVTPENDAPLAVNDNFTLSGLKGNYWGYNEGPDGTNLISLSQVTSFMAGHNPSATFTSTTLNYNLSGGDLGGDGNLQKFLGNDAKSLNTDPANTSDAIIQLTGAINLNAGSYQLRVNADDGFSIKIDGVEVFKYDNIQSPTGRESAVFTIAQSGSHSIEIVYWDQGGQAQLQVEMRPQNGTYTTVGGTSLTHTVGELVTNEDTALTIAPQTLLGNDSDVDGDSLTIVSVQNAVNGSVKLEGGNVVFTPAKDVNGSGSFTYTISDGHGGTSTATVTVGINAVNDAPEAKNDQQTTGENNTYNGQVPAATDIDSAVNPNGYSLVQSVGAGNGTLTFNANGSYVFNPGTDFDSLNVGESRQVTFTYTAKDAQGAVSAPATVTITVTGSNDLPTATASTVTLNEDGKRSFSASDFGFSDKDAGDALKAIRIDNLPTAGSLTLNGQSVTAGQVIAVSLLASLVYTPVANAAGNAYATLKFSVQDSHDGFSSSSSTLTFNVTPVNDAPLSADGSASVYAGKTYTFGTKDFAFSDTADSANGQNHSLQNILIKALPDSGTLLLNGTAVKAGQAISASDVAGGKLTFVPDASGSNAHFSFAVQDSGGVANGGVDTSPTYGFDIHVGQVQIPSTNPNGDNTLTGGSGDDVILGDVGGIKTLTQGGTNYNIALVVDTSGSMAYNLAGQSGAAYANSRMKLVKDALISLANELKGHDGIINISLIGFQSTASLKVSITDLSDANIDQLVNAIGQSQNQGLQAVGGTDYQEAFGQAVSWFNDQKNSYENITLFLTDGDPTESSGNGSLMQNTTQAFASLSALSEVRAIGIGTNVNESTLKYFDNTNVTGMGTVYTTATKTLFTFDNNSALPGWTLSKSSTGAVGISGNKLSMTDTSAAGSSTAITSDLTVAKNTTSSFSFDFTESMRSGDTFTWTLKQYVDGAWTQVETHTLTSSSSNTTYTTDKAVGEGTYRIDFVLTDNTTSGTASITLDNLKQIVNTYAPVGQVDIVKQASDLTAALHGGSTSTELAPSGHDTINGGAGDDIIFGDTINTDNLPWGVNGNPAKPADMPAGSGVSALSAFLELKNGHAATSDEMYDYIKANHALFNVEGDTRGGDDHLYGGDGNDILYGQGGNDFLFGENGNDILFGGTGDDQLTGGKGDDILTGGAGADTFIWKAGDIGNDTITDFKAGESDRIDISDLLPETAHNDILSYLKVDTTTSTLQVSTTGQINNGGAADVTIKLSGVDLSTYGSTSTEIVNKLVAGSDPVVKTEHH